MSDPEQESGGKQRLTFSKGISEIFSTLDSQDRLDSFVLLANGWSAKKVSESENLSRSTLQNYVNDFKRNGLITKDGNRYKLTEKGGRVRSFLFAWDEAYPVILNAALRDQVESSGLDVDQDAVNDFGGLMLMQSRDLTQDQVASQDFWEKTRHGYIFDELQEIYAGPDETRLEELDRRFEEMSREDNQVEGLEPDEKVRQLLVEMFRSRGEHERADALEELEEAPPLDSYEYHGVEGLSREEEIVLLQMIKSEMDFEKVDFVDFEDLEEFDDAGEFFDSLSEEEEEQIKSALKESTSQ